MSHDGQNVKKILCPPPLKQWSPEGQKTKKISIPPDIILQGGVEGGQSGIILKYLYIFIAREIPLNLLEIFGNFLQTTNCNDEIILGSADW